MVSIVKAGLITAFVFVGFSAISGTTGTAQRQTFGGGGGGTSFFGLGEPTAPITKKDTSTTPTTQNLPDVNIFESSIPQTTNVGLNDAGATKKSSGTFLKDKFINGREGVQEGLLTKNPQTRQSTDFEKATGIIESKKETKAYTDDLGQGMSIDEYKATPTKKTSKTAPIKAIGTPISTIRKILGGLF